MHAGKKMRCSILAYMGMMACAAGAVNATTVAMDADPLGSRASSTVEFAYWDSFTETQVNPPSGTTYTFNGVANASSTLTNLGLAQNSAHVTQASVGPSAQGAGLLNDGDVYYSSTSPQSWTLNATSSIEIEQIAFQIKTANVVNETVMTELFTPTLNGIGAATYFSATASGESIFGFPAYVIEYRWTDLDIPANTPLQITFSLDPSTADFRRKPVDLVALDVTSVPEPTSAAALLGVGAMTLGLRRRR